MRTGSANHQFCWNELITPEPDAASDFYCGLFGWEKVDIPLLGSTYTLFSSEKSIAGLLKSQTNQPPQWISYIQVETLEPLLERVIELGGSISVQPTSIPERGRFAVFIDNTGAPCAMWEPSDA